MTVASEIFKTINEKFVAIAIMNEEQLYAISKAMDIELANLCKGKLRIRKSISKLSDLIAH